MNFKCLFGFHDYLDMGMYWRYKYTPYSKSLMGVDVVKIVQCVICNKAEEIFVEYYPVRRICLGDGFDHDCLIRKLESRGIKHVEEYYADKKRVALFPTSKERS